MNASGSGTSLSPRGLGRAWNRFFFESGVPATCDRFRVAYSLVLIAYVVGLGADLELFHSTTGLLTYEASRSVIDPDTSAWLLALAPNSDPWLWTCYASLLGCSVALLSGIRPRTMAVLVFALLVSFQHRNILLLDGEDCLFRMFALLLCFMPLSRGFRVFGSLRSSESGEAVAVTSRAWALRLVQVQMCLVYFVSGIHKLRGSDWLQGHALYYISRLDDLFGLFPLPGFLLESPDIGRLLSWSLVPFEILLPFALWTERTRLVALVAALSFHASLAYSMNLFFFHYVMAAGLVAFTRPGDGIRLLRGLRGTTARLLSLPKILCRRA